MFIDLVKIEIKSGNGGNGTVAWRREKYVPKGGPAGGDGGRGGHVYLQADTNLSTLLEFKYKAIYHAENGGRGMSRNCHGKNSDDLVIRVPEGTLVKDAATGVVVADLYKSGQKVLVAAGGKGGRGNARFANSVRQAPQFCEPGEPGVERTLELELKLLADVGIIGLPNAGKSTYISVVSAAKPKIANYPFTTLIPNLGVVKTHDLKGIVFADIPGLIEGSSEGIGLGHQFLRHVERTRLLIHFIDILEGDPVKNYHIINNELRKYSDHLASLEQIIAINKIDATDEETIELVKELLYPELEGKAVFLVSAATQQGTKELTDYTLERLEKTPKEESFIEVIEDPGAFANDDSTFEVYCENGAYIVDGGKVHRLVNITDLTNTEALYRLQGILKSMGVFDALKAAGVKDGDMVIAGQLEFEYLDEEYNEFEDFSDEEEYVEYEELVEEEVK